MSEWHIKCPESVDEETGQSVVEQFYAHKVKRGDSVVADLSATTAMDAKGGAWLVKLAQLTHGRDAEFAWEGQQGEVAELVDLIEPGLVSGGEREHLELHPIDKIADRGVAAWGEITDAMELIVDATYWTILAPFGGRGFRWGLFVDEVYEMGVRALGINFLMNYLLGLTIAMLSAAQLKDFGLDLYVTYLVMIGFARELAAIMSAVVVSARTGAAVTAEISTMKVQEEIDALRGMGINVPQYIVAPKLLALMVVLPILTGLGMIAGVLGGLTWGVVALGFSPELWFEYTLYAADMGDIFQGLLKAFIFAQVIILVACHNGFRVTGGSRGVGLMTTRAVVMDIFFIITIDMVFAGIFYYVLP